MGRKSHLVSTEREKNRQLNIKWGCPLPPSYDGVLGQPLLCASYPTLTRRLWPRLRLHQALPATTTSRVDGERGIGEYRLSEHPYPFRESP